MLNRWWWMEQLQSLPSFTSEFVDQVLEEGFLLAASQKVLIVVTGTAVLESQMWLENPLVACHMSVSILRFP